MDKNNLAERMVSLMDEDESAFNDTPETAPIMPRTKRSVDAAEIRELRNSSKYKDLKDRFRADCARQRRVIDGVPVIGAPCALCSGDIDYMLQYPHPFSFSADHIITVKENPGLLMDGNNLQAAHLDCNLGRGTDDPAIDLGEPSEAW